MNEPKKSRQRDKWPRFLCSSDSYCYILENDFLPLLSGLTKDADGLVVGAQATTMKFMGREGYMWCIIDNYKHIKIKVHS